MQRSLWPENGAHDWQSHTEIFAEKCAKALSQAWTRLPVKKPLQILLKYTELENVEVWRNDVLLEE